MLILFQTALKRQAKSRDFVANNKLLVLYIYVLKIDLNFCLNWRFLTTFNEITFVSFTTDTGFTSLEQKNSTKYLSTPVVAYPINALGRAKRFPQVLIFGVKKSGTGNPLTFKFLMQWNRPCCTILFPSGKSGHSHWNVYGSDTSDFLEFTWTVSNTSYLLISRRSHLARARLQDMIIELVTKDALIPLILKITSEVKVYLGW